MINEEDDWFVHRYSSNLASNNKRVDLFDGPAEDNMEENVLLASSNPLSFKDFATIFLISSNLWPTKSI